MKLDNFFTSGWTFDESDIDLKSRYQMVNIGIVLSCTGLLYGIVINTIKDISGLIPFEVAIIFINIMLFFILRISRKSFEYVSLSITIIFTFFFLFLMSVGNPMELSHVWLFTYPIIILYYQKKERAIYWMAFLITILLVAPFQDFVEVKHSLYQMITISVVLLIVTIIASFYHINMDKALKLILQQQKMLKVNNAELAKQLKELQKKDQLLTTQSKQAVMGEMISMIAHQWRQPLSMITLQIANYQIEQLMYTSSTERKIDKTLSEISDTIIYLSETVDDFQTYFNPKKDILEIEIEELIQRAINFVLPRCKHSGAIIELQKGKKIHIRTYVNEVIQVILNILNNAIDAIDSDKIKEPKILVRFFDMKKSIKIEIKDNANGIDSKNIGHLFEPYFSTKGKNGTGLGLYMSQMIVQKQFESEIVVQSSKDGSIFSFSIPKNIKTIENSTTS